MSGEEWEEVCVVRSGCSVGVVSCGRVCGKWEEWGMVCDW